MDAIKFILQEHAQIRKSLTQLKKYIQKDDKSAKTKFTRLTQFLVRHETMEEKVWYPALRKEPNLKKIITLLVSEEKKASKAIKKIKTIHDDKKWNQQVLKLSLDVGHHANDEEKKLFPKVRQLIDKDVLLTLGQRLRSYKAARKRGKTL